MGTSADPRRFVQLANHIFPSNRTGHAVGMFLDHVMSVMGNAGSVVFSSLMVALPRQSLPACVVQPSMSHHRCSCVL